MILLNPGPVTLSDQVRGALNGDDLCHREPEFAVLQNSIRQHLIDVYGLQNQWAAIVLTGSGTAAVEAMVTSLIPENKELLVVANGVYGERMASMAKRAQITTHVQNNEWLKAPELAAIESALKANPEISHVAIVHHETTTGRLNDLAPIAEICERFGVRILLDGVSSFGAEDIDFNGWPLDGCAATANKCLHGVPGPAFVIARRQAVANGSSRSVYLALQDYLVKQDLSGTPFTPSVQTFYALDAALVELKAMGGQPARKRLYEERLGNVREKLQAIGVTPLLEDGVSSCVLQSFIVPDHCSYDALHDGLKKEGFVIYAGQGNFADKIFRISTMGEIPPAAIERLSHALEKLLAS
ncbi:MAG: 2-aminoethylphosphonate aminotransferase [Pseudomonadota bacterium]